ncbi:hypothetical protein GOP47_0009730 [Adiantum capillus-veneris]|uniref:Uncharacterized protein n=1 Tax=Adiantum capillus-veneris TaxID=13818 RepID=A0A9D4ZHH6_ADICA|nr:hypothetical protein GOP47_0009730 [Adiantum capillus-veneris]
MDASTIGGVGGPWGWETNGWSLQLQGIDRFEGLNGACNELEGDAEDTSCGDGHSCSTHDVEDFFEEHQSVHLDAFALESGQEITIGALKAQDKRGLLDLKKRARIKDSFQVVVDQGGSMCLAIGNGKLIACIEDWECIVFACHSNDHLWRLQATMTAIACMWCTNIKRHGIPLAYVKEFLDLCVCGSLPSLRELQAYDTTSTEQCPGLRDRQKIGDKGEGGIEEHTMPKDDVKDVINTVAIKHKARLVKRQSFSSGFIQLVCHQHGEARRVGHDHSRLRTAKKCGCTFRVII